MRRAFLFFPVVFLLIACEEGTQPLTNSDAGQITDAELSPADAATFPDAEPPPRPGCGDGIVQAGELCLGPEMIHPERIVAITDFNNDRALDVVVRDRLVRMRGEPPIEVRMNDGTGKLSSTPSFTAPSNTWLDLVDFDGDGNTDIIRDTPVPWDQPGVPGFVVELGGGDGTFTRGYEREEPADAFSWMDYDDNGFVDLLSRTNQRFEIVLNDRGALGNRLIISPLRIEDSAILVEDFVTNNRRDLVFANYDFGDQIFREPVLYVANENGFEPSPIPITTDTWVLSPQALDVDEDGRLDIVTGVPNAGVRVQFGLGDGTFMPVLIVELAEIVALSMDLDSNELLVGAGDPPRVMIYAMQGREDAVLVDTQELTLPITFLYSVDIDPFPPNDIFVQHSSTETTHGFLLRQSSGRLQPEIADVAPACTVFGTRIVDFDADGYRDLVCGRGVVLRYDPKTGSIPAPQVLQLPLTRPTSLLPIDANADGSIDLVSEDLFMGQLAVMYGHDGVFDEASVQSVEHQVSQLYAGDLDLDGLAELVARTSLGIDVFEYRGDTMSYELSGGPIPGSEGPPGVFRARIDDDSIDDLITSGELWIGNAAGSFSKPPLAAKHANDRERCAGTCFAGVAALGELDGDTFVDLASTSTSNSNLIDIYRGGADQSFAFAYSVSINAIDFEQIVSLAIDDADGDNDLDLIVAGTRAVRVFENDRGQLALVHEFPLLEEDQLNRVQVADIDSDGRADLLVSSGHGSNSGLRGRAAFGVLLGQSGGGFATARWFGVHLEDFDFAVEDFDRDGRLDVAVLSHETGSLIASPNTVSVMLQRP